MNFIEIWDSPEILRCSLPTPASIREEALLDNNTATKRLAQAEQAIELTAALGFRLAIIRLY